MECYCHGMDSDCPLCHGSGTLPDCDRCKGLCWTASPTDDGGYENVLCSNAACIRGQPDRIVYTGLGSEMASWTFDNMTKEHGALLEVAEDIRKKVLWGWGWTVMFTRPGRGKSYLMAAAINLAVSIGQMAYYTQHKPLMRELVDAAWQRHPKGYSETALMRKLTTMQVLCIDEMGEYSPTTYQDANCRELFVSRADGYGWPCTFFGTNKTQKEIRQRYPWLEDRFQAEECSMYDLQGVGSLRGRLK